MLYGYDDGDDVPVVVSPLLPDDPKPGDKMIWRIEGFRDDEVTVGGAPWGDYVPVLTASGNHAFPSRQFLHRPPVLKTFRVKQSTPLTVYDRITIRAESREAALAKLAESLEEVT